MLLLLILLCLTCDHLEWLVSPCERIALLNISVLLLRLLMLLYELALALRRHADWSIVGTNRGRFVPLHQILLIILNRVNALIRGWCMRSNWAFRCGVVLLILLIIIASILLDIICKLWSCKIRSRLMLLLWHYSSPWTIHSTSGWNWLPSGEIPWVVTLIGRVHNILWLMVTWTPGGISIFSADLRWWEANFKLVIWLLETRSSLVVIQLLLLWLLLMLLWCLGRCLLENLRDRLLWSARHLFQLLRHCLEMLNIPLCL